MYLYSNKSETLFQWELFCSIMIFSFFAKKYCGKWRPMKLNLLVLPKKTIIKLKNQLFQEHAGILRCKLACV